MSLHLNEKQWEEVHAYQAKEIESLATDNDLARSASGLDYYSRVGEWLSPKLGKHALEVGCGPGRYVAMLASLGFDVVGIDPITFPTWQVIKLHHKVEFRDGTFAEALPFSNASFDHVACIGALLYFKDPIRALAEIRRVLRPGGRLVIRSVNRSNLYRIIKGQNMDPAARNHYTMAEFVKLLLDAGFEVHERFSYGFYPPFFASRWWHLVNGRISVKTQILISKLTPAPFRANLVLFCKAP